MKLKSQEPKQDSGTVLVMALVMMIALASIAAAFMGTASSSHSEGRQVRESMRAFYAAEGALIEAFAVLRTGDRDAFEALQYPLEIDGASYTVTATYGDEDDLLGDDLVRLQAVATDGTETSTLSLLLRGSSSGQQLAWQVFSYNDITMNSNSYVDSYCSSDGTWAKQKKKNWHGARYVEETAMVGTNGDFELDSNSAVMGTANPGVGGNVSMAGNSKVFGATTPLEETVELEPVTIPPALVNQGDWVIDDKKTSIGPGEFLFDDLLIDGNTVLTVISPTTIYLTGNFEMNSNSEVKTDTGLPEGLTLYMSNRRKTAILDSNSDLIGNIHAPQCDVELNSNSEVTGYVMCDSLHMDSNAAIHVDTCMGNGSAGSGNGSTEYEVVSWVMTSENPH